MTVLLVALGAALGAPARYLADRAVQARLGTAFPWGTFTVNVVGCLILGALAGSGTVPTDVVTLVGTGFCGALTTYSTFSWEAMKLPLPARRRTSWSARRSASAPPPSAGGSPSLSRCVSGLRCP